MWSFILFVLIAAWILYDIVATYKYVSKNGFDLFGVAYRFFLAAPVDFVKWIISLF